MTPTWEVAAAETFWEIVGEAPPFPRNVHDLIPLAFPLGVVTLPALALDRVAEWLARRGRPDLLPSECRRLRGCLVVHAGAGFVFVDGADAPDERRFTLAHEIAHYFLDYLQPRQRAVARLGPGIVAVLDGRRPPTIAERLDAALKHCPVGVYVHLLDRGDAHVTAAEERADRLACELLAPRAVLLPLLRGADLATTVGVLRERFGLPPDQAKEYALTLAREWRPARSHVEWLRR